MWIVPQHQKGTSEDFKLELETRRGRWFLIGASTKAHFCWLTVKALKGRCLLVHSLRTAAEALGLQATFFFFFSPELAPAIL